MVVSRLAFFRGMLVRGFPPRIGVRGRLFNDEFRGNGVVAWYSESARRILPRPAPTPAGDEPLASRSLRPRYIPLTHTPSGFQPRIGVRGRLFAGMTK